MFLPTTLESTDKIVETIEELKVKIPSNPLEADILAMAEMIAEAEELDKASSDLCGRQWTVVIVGTALALCLPVRVGSVVLVLSGIGRVAVPGPSRLCGHWARASVTDLTSLPLRSCEQPECRGTSGRL